jgi:hypothetical protein
MSIARSMIDSAWQAYYWTEDPDSVLLPEIDPLQKNSGGGIGGA